MSQVMAGICIMFGVALILWETSAVVRGEETNYIRATVGIYVALYQHLQLGAGCCSASAATTRTRPLARSPGDSATRNLPSEYGGLAG